MTMLAAAAAVFVLMHLLISGTPLRDRITAVIGEGPYMGLFSLASVAALAWLIIAFAHARGGPGDAVFWTINPATRYTAIVLALISFLLAVPGLLTNSPTRVAGGSQVDKPSAISGMTRISRNPFLWGVAVWAAAHLLTNGSLSAVLLFGPMLILGLAGPLSIDAKRLRALGEPYRNFMAQTSNIPFAAIVQGRQTLKLGEIWWRLLVALALFALTLWLHPKLFGANPLG
ncbi:MAG TPA: NnrU family protein [Caulobacteraceae bacterium]|jgi:uncharacterized membrane protein|nr:NnrU family protein [Caulobacteraceae bacterium]